MCVGAPKVKTPEVPSIPERQATKLPDNGSTAAASDLLARRRRGLYASIVTGPAGLLGAPNVSRAAAVTRLG